MTKDTPTPSNTPTPVEDTSPLRSEWSSLERAGVTLRTPSPLTVDATTYTFIKPLERRSIGEVMWLAQRSTRDGPCGLVAVKRLLGPASSPRRHRLIEEVELAFRLRHPAIAQVHHLRMHEGMPHILMEYVDGPSLDTVVSAAAARGRPVSLSFALYVAGELAEALHHAHTAKDEAGRPLGVVHRDVSPRNVRVEGSTGAVKLTHFGAAYSLLANREESPKTLLKGDVAYASPEYLFQQRPLDARSDVFSLGVTLAELLTGAHLFDLEDATRTRPVGPLRPEERPSLPLEQMQGFMERLGPEDVQRAAAGLPEPLQALLHKALRKEPTERYATAGVMRDVLRAALARQPQPYGRKEAAEELGRLLSEATVLRGRAEFAEAGLFPDMQDAHELEPDGPASPAPGSNRSGNMD
ncbi:serine/threonine-protein kinase [Corallococcus llansteffanensis]|uniref:Serine/threonine protein kinase n=1 Tax=Corallococcus llansteffanensis TaxID=2316731 RepID=A0A3A8QIE5_9BACT|nr:serine/threonine-protein kinase [Corallococcus llansteffanensis]RKH67491.1 serine/threonine protein kinase [Corallococcus llansteffanensis]